MRAAVVDDELWEPIQPLLPRRRRRYRHPGRRRIDDRTVLNGILFVLTTGIAWQRLPKELGFGSGMTCWRRLRDWQKAGRVRVALRDQREDLAFARCQNVAFPPKRDSRPTSRRAEAASPSGCSVLMIAYDARRMLARLGYDANDGEALAALAAWAERFDGELEHRPEIVSEGVGRGARVQRGGATIRPVLLWLPADFTTFREGIADIARTVQRCLENYEHEHGNRASKMEQLSPGDCERIRFAIKDRHDLDTVRDLLWGTEMAKVLGHQFLDQLAAADQKLKPDQVSELVTQALADIPERP